MMELKQISLGLARGSFIRRLKPWASTNRTDESVGEKKYEKDKERVHHCYYSVTDDTYKEVYRNLLINSPAYCEAQLQTFHLGWLQITRITMKQDLNRLKCWVCDYLYISGFTGCHPVWISIASCSHKGRWNQINFCLYCLISPPDQLLKETPPTCLSSKAAPTPNYFIQGQRVNSPYLSNKEGIC